MTKQQIKISNNALLWAVGDVAYQIIGSILSRFTKPLDEKSCRMQA